MDLVCAVGSESVRALVPISISGSSHNELHVRAESDSLASISAIHRFDRTSLFTFHTKWQSCRETSQA